MAMFTSEKRKKNPQNTETGLLSGSIKRRTSLSARQAVIFAAVFGLIGGIIILKSFAAEPPIKTYKAPNTFQPPLESKAKQQTMRLVNLTNKLQKKPNDQSIQQEVTQVAQERAATIHELVSKQPKTAVLVHFPNDLLSTLPASARASVESEVSIQGKLNITHGESIDPKTQQFFNPIFYYDLVDSAGNHYNLHFEGEGPEDLGENTVKVSGVQLGSDVAVGSESDVTVTGGVLGVTTSKKVAVLLFTFSDNTSQPFTPAQVKTTVFGGTAPSVNTYYTEQSFNQVGVGGILDPANGDVFGWYALSDTSTSCNYSTWTTNAKKAAQAAGIDLSGYSNFVSVFPKVSACSWAGLGNMPGSGTWINGAGTSTSVIAHELGHNFGVHHASSLTCLDSNGNKVIYSSNCTMGEYGDPFDVMGSGSGHMNNFHKGQLHYLQASNTQDVNTSGTYAIAPIEYATSSVQSLRIPIAFNSSNVPTSYYYLEARAPGINYDKYPATYPAANGVLIRIAPGYNTITQSGLLDTTPGTSFSDQPLLVGQRYDDSIHNISITTNSASTSGASVSINFGPISNPCVRANPTVSVTPASQWGTPGTALTYTATVTNNDNSSCPVSVFSLSNTTTMPSGWNFSSGSGLPSIAPGATATSTVTIRSPSTATSGFYNFSILVTNSSAPTTIYKTSASFNYNIGTSTDTTAPIPKVTSPLSGATVNGVVNVVGTATDNVGVTNLELYIDGSMRAFSTTGNVSYAWDTEMIANGTHTLYTKAYDAAGNAATSPTVSVTVSNAGDTVAPAVNVTNPVNGATASGSLNITATATDNVGVTKMEVYIDGTKTATSSTSNISSVWNTTTASNGSHIITVKAYDAAANVGTSAAVNVTVSNTTVSATGDLNNDGHVTITDMSILLSNYGTTNPTADINKDGAVNITDLSILLSHYGT